MNAIRISKRIDSETLHLPELKDLIGKKVEITLREEVDDAPVKRSRYDAFSVGPTRAEDDRTSGYGRWRQPRTAA